MARRTFRRFVLVGVSMLVLALGAAPAASAGSLTGALLECPDYEAKQVFLPWLDVANYTLMQDGTFEAPPKLWSLSGGAKVVSGNERYDVAGSGHKRALQLTSGSSATSPTICTRLVDPTIRLFVANKGSLLSTLKVDVLYEDASGAVQSATVAEIVAGSSWEPTLPLLFLANVTGVAELDGDGTVVAFRFTPTGLFADWRIDDFYVDPFKSS